MTSEPTEALPNQRMRRAQLVTAGAVVTGVLFSLGMAVAGLGIEHDPLRIVLGACGLLIFSVALAAVLRRAVTPAHDATAGRPVLIGFGVASVLSVALVGPLAADRWQTWAYLSSLIVGLAPLLLRWRAAAAVMVVATAVSGATAWWVGASIGGYLVLTAGIGLSIAAWNELHLWIWRFLVQAQEGRDALTRLAATEERLRFARDVHDLLGHNLSVIALKAELASRLAPVDPQRAVEEAGEVRALAAAALAEMREVVHGYRDVDLREQAQAVAKVLRSSGVRCDVSQPDGELPAGLAVPLVAALREASTNVMRHSRAQWCTIEIVHDGAEARMTIVNDGASGGQPDRHSYGLRGLADRLRDAGGALRTWEKDGMFSLEATVRARS